MKGHPVKMEGEEHGLSLRFQLDDVIFHTYSAYMRGWNRSRTPTASWDTTSHRRQQDFEGSPADWPQSLGHMIAWVSEVAHPQNREIMMTSVLKAIGYFEAPRKFQHDCGGKPRVEGGQIWLHFQVAATGTSELLRR